MTALLPRTQAIRLIHIAKRDLALVDDDYRGLLERLTGKSSCKDMSDAELAAVRAELGRQGWKPKANLPAAPRSRAMAQKPEARKARALWLTGWNLGIFPSKDEAALSGFVKRLTGKAALQFCDAVERSSVIEALKARLTREGLPPPIAAVVQTYNLARERAGLDAASSGLAEKVALVRAQWLRLAKLDPATCEPYGGQLGTWLALRPGGRPQPHLMADRDLDAAAVDLGRLLRAAQGRQAPAKKRTPATS